MGAGLCGKEGTEYMCNNRHVMKYVSIAENPEDFLNQRASKKPRICVQCSKGVQECRAQVCWECKPCQFYYCAKCKGYKTDVCPQNHKLEKKNDFSAKDDAFCDICTSPIMGEAFNCKTCRFNVCTNCQGAKKNKKK